tara:strand:+ start:239 stop:370 length:132 start_codon:yes stop_codon:yes gene_type:complete
MYIVLAAIKAFVENVFAFCLFHAISVRPVVRGLGDFFPPEMDV